MKFCRSKLTQKLAAGQKSSIFSLQANGCQRPKSSQGSLKTFGVWKKVKSDPFSLKAINPSPKWPPHMVYNICQNKIYVSEKFLGYVFPTGPKIFQYFQGKDNLLQHVNPSQCIKICIIYIWNPHTRTVRETELAGCCGKMCSLRLLLHTQQFPPLQITFC